MATFRIMLVEQKLFLDKLRSNEVSPTFSELSNSAVKNIDLAIEKLGGADDRTKDAVNGIIGQIQRLRGELGGQIDGILSSDHPIHPPFSAYHGLKDWIDRLTEYVEEDIIPFRPI